MINQNTGIINLGSDEIFGSAEFDHVNANLAIGIDQQLENDGIINIKTGAFVYIGGFLENFGTVNVGIEPTTELNSPAQLEIEGSAENDGTINLGCFGEISGQEFIFVNPVTDVCVVIPPEPTLRIDKITNVDGTFDFSLTDGVSTNNGFIVTDGGFGSNSGFVIVSGTTYTLSETSPGEEWSTTIDCAGSTAGPNGGSTFTANDGDSIVCTITNTFTEPPEPEGKKSCDALEKASENGKGKKKGLERAKANNNC